tara:strand:- start:8315 stop:8593 length:279 start_codon:yes stop_codon:yes gene_type:complete
MNEKMMNEGHEYFANQEEEISNKFMSANGDSDKYSNMRGYVSSQAIYGSLAIIGLLGYFAYKKYGGKGILYFGGGLVAFYKIDKKYKILPRK